MRTQQVVQPPLPHRGFWQFAIQVSLLQFSPQSFIFSLMKAKIRLFQVPLFSAGHFSFDQFRDVRQLERLVQPP